MSDTLIKPFSHPSDLESVGGKGLNLSRLVRAGLPVPPGFTVATPAYNAYVRQHNLDGVIRQALAGAGPEDRAVVAAASQTIRHAFAAHPIPESTAHPILEAYAALGRPPVAVRSSATAEDLPGLSFAGQQETVLNAVGEDALLAAVVRCWSSLWTARAIAYRTRNELAEQAVALAVVVQTMVPAEASGVLFTANPLTGKRDESVIDAALGLGEALVEGRVSPDHYVVDRSGRILEKTLGSKALAIRPRAGGGTTVTQQDAGDRPALPDAALRDLVALGRQVAELLGGPQDIEWAWVDGRIALLQARPITTLYPLPSGLQTPGSDRPLRALFSFGAVQGILDPITPLGRDHLTALMIGAGRVFGVEVEPEAQHMVWEAGQRLWIDFSGALRHRLGRRLTLGALPNIDPGAADAIRRLLDQGAFDPPRGLRLAVAARIVRALLPMTARALATLLWPDAQRRRLQRNLDAFTARVLQDLARRDSLTARVAAIRETTIELFGVVIPEFAPRFAVGMAGYNLLTRLADRLPEGAYDTRAMMRGVSHNVTTEMDLALWRVARTIREDPPAAEAFRTAPPEQLAQAYLTRDLPAAVLAPIEGFMAQYGMRGLAEIDLGRPRWREAPQPVIRALQAYLAIDDPALAPDIVHERGREAAERGIDRLVQALRRRPGGAITATLARRAAHRMRALIGLRESPKFTLVGIFGALREMLLDVGDHLVAAGTLAHRDDVVYLGIDELMALAAETEQPKTPAPALPPDRLPDTGADAISDLVARRRTAARRESRRRQIPRLQLSDGRAFYEGTPPDAEAEASAGTLRGEPVSPGVVEGPVQVVRDPGSAHLAPGAILVCPGTDPSWTPLFLVAGGLVMEVGGMMTHGAVVAREYGLPAVVGVTRATERLRTGQRIRVDGATGRITLLDPADD